MNNTPKTENDDELEETKTYCEQNKGEETTWRYLEASQINSVESQEEMSESSETQHNSHT